MTIVYRTTGTWGAGKGSNLTPAEVDGNFYDLHTRLAALETGGADVPATIDNITIIGSLFTVEMSDGSSFEQTLRIPRVPEVTSTSATSMTLAITDADKFFLCTAGCAVSIPSDAEDEIPLNSEIHFRQHGTDGLTFAVANPSVTTLHGVDGYDNETDAQGSTVTLKKIAADEWIIIGLMKVTV